MTYGIDYTSTRELAPRTHRLLAALVDGLLLAVFALFGLFGGFTWVAGALLKGAAAGQALSLPRPAGTSSLLLFGSLAAALLFTLYQWYGLAVRGQTLGKRLFGIEIVDSLGASAGFLRALLLRSWVFGILVSLANGFLGGLGGLLPLVDVLPIFGSERRCLHDYLAGTWVRTARESSGRGVVPAVLFAGAAVALGVLVAREPRLPVEELRQVVARHGSLDGDLSFWKRGSDGDLRSTGRAGPKDDVVLSGPKGTKAPLYRWVDETGAENFADGLEAVPARYRKQATRAH